MTCDKINWFTLEKHLTKDISDGHTNGVLIPIWKDFEKIVQIVPKMLYVTTVNSGETKGPHLHTKRDSYFVCIKGKVIFIVKDHSGKYFEIESSDEKPTLIQVPKNFSSAHINTGSEPAIVLAIANIAWKPGDNEMKNVLFEDYDWKKWKLLE